MLRQMPPLRHYPGRRCRVCGKFVYLNRQGEYRRHFTDTDGVLRLCPATNRDALTDKERERQGLALPQ
jgi:hypothetical protein